jgi:Bcr/CflA subfamily drug resistance transporter
LFRVVYYKDQSRIIRMIARYINTARNEKNLLWFPVFLIIYNFAGNLSNDIYMPSMPELVNYFGSTKNTIQLTLVAWFAGVAIPQLFFGPLSDRVGRKLLLLIGGVDFILATLLCAVAPNITVLIIGRFLQGVGVCSLNVASFATVRELYDYQQSVRILAYINICGSLAPLLGPVIGGYIFIWLGWQMNFIVVFLAALIALIGLWFLMPESLLSRDVNALRPKHVMNNYKQLLSNHYFIKHLAAYGLLLGGIIAYLTSAPFLVINTWKVSPEYFGFTQLPIFGCYILGSSLIGRAVKRFGGRRMINIGLLIIICAITIMLVCALLKLNYLAIFIVSMSGYAFGYSLASSPMTAEAMASTKTATGSAAALLGFSMALSGTLSSFIVGLVYDGKMLSVAAVIFVLVVSSLGIFFSKKKQ